MIGRWCQMLYISGEPKMHVPFSDFAPLVIHLFEWLNEAWGLQAASV